VPELTPLDRNRGEANVAVYAVAEWINGDRPAVLMLHGALRTAANLSSWPARLRDVADVYLMELPAHGASAPIEAPTTGKMATLLSQAIADRIRNDRVLVVGESVGGLVAMAMAGGAAGGPVRAVLAFDPPLTTRKLWAWRRERLAARREMGRRNPALGAFDREVFGVQPDGLDERIYYDLVGDAEVPVVIAAGDQSPFSPNFRGAPSVFDDVDRFVIERLYPGKADVRLLRGCGHVLLEDAPDACADLIVDVLATHLQTPRGSPRPPARRA
jgi:pimeloyl-ACP methyl ester carboxylesterase